MRAGMSNQRYTAPCIMVAPDTAAASDTGAVFGARLWQQPAAATAATATTIATALPHIISLRRFCTTQKFCAVIFNHIIKFCGNAALIVFQLIVISAGR